jgi:prophage antirepressor-like protein
MASQECEMDKIIFDDIELTVVDHGGQPCLTLSEVAIALYGKGGDESATPFDSRVRDLYRRHADEFTPTMTALVKMQTRGGEQEVRVFSLRGAHLLGMFARTERAKRFRRRVLDVLDNELREGRSLSAEFQRTLLEYSGKQAVASLCGRGLRQWQTQKPPLEARLNDLVAQLQPSLPLN